MSRAEELRALRGRRGRISESPGGASGIVQPITDVSAAATYTPQPMGVKYYTHFVLTGEAAEGSDQEFSGVVEVNQATEARYETKDIEALLARNFDLRSGEVRLINWARLQ
jgi:hypothetical protein